MKKKPVKSRSVGLFATITILQGFFEIFLVKSYACPLISNGLGPNIILQDESAGGKNVGLMNMG